MFGPVKRYVKWLHTGWPAGTVEKLPDVKGDYSTNVPGIYVTGDLTGIPLLKFSSDSGARAVSAILADKGFESRRRAEREPGILDLVIVGAGVSGMAAALEAKKNGLSFEILEASEPFSTIVNFPRAKPIYTYPTEMAPKGSLQFTADVKEALLEEMREETLGRGIEPKSARVEKVVSRGGFVEAVIPEGKSVKALAAIVAIGRSGGFRMLGVPGEDRDRVYNRLHDPADFTGKQVLVVGGGDSALEAAIAIARAGGHVTLSYRGGEFSRAKPENVQNLNMLVSDPMADVSVETPVSERVTTSAGGFMPGERRAGSVKIMMKSRVTGIGETDVTLTDGGGEEIKLPNDAVFTMLGREAPLGFLRQSGVKIKGEIGVKGFALMGLFLLFCAFVYNWKAGGSLTKLFKNNEWFPYNLPGFFGGLGPAFSRMAEDPSTLIGTTAITLTEPGFYYALAYTGLVIVFGIMRIRRRKTPYITVQTITLALVQMIPLFLLPYFVLPYLGHNGLFDSGFLKTAADALFPVAGYGQGREYWRAFGLILAWPLFIWNVFSSEPLWTWLVISLIQTFILIPLIIYFWGKGAYCGWICSCGAMAETLGDTHRHKMPHGAGWNRLNMAGQVILAIAFIILFARLISWALPGTGFGRSVSGFYDGALFNWQPFGIQLNYRWAVDLFLAGIVGYGLYFWYSGRVWCRFLCPLAALMHIYARFSRFRILADKKKCISCNVCTSVCHQGIDVMNFANKGIPMSDPECVRCSACVQSCPTGVLSFGQIDTKTGRVIKVDGLGASPVLMREGKAKHADPGAAP